MDVCNSSAAEFCEMAQGWLRIVVKWHECSGDKIESPWMPLVLFHSLLFLEGSESLLLLLNRSQVLYLNTESCSDPLPRGALIDPNSSLSLLLTSSLDMQWPPCKGLSAFPIPEWAVPGPEHPEKQNLCLEKSVCDLSAAWWSVRV